MSNVLIVDDDPMIRKLLGKMLATKKISSIAVSGGDEALKVLPSEPISHIILDLNMPDGLSGDDTLKEIHEKFPNIPVILSTGDGSMIDKSKYISMGVSKFLNKPFDLNDLFSAIE